ncbi:MAG: hypothetical protein M3R13_08105 [Armatimonadota bacterium]|nr:hypothetical protein [Armatimonadota bacterium]
MISVAVAVSAAAAFAQPTTYGRADIEIKAGVLLFNRTLPNGALINSAPYVFYYMDRRNDLKPRGWNFVNPQSASTFTTDQANRWNLLTGGGFAAGQKLGKNYAAYWEVELDRTTPAILSKYDILYVNDLGSQITPEQREKLRQFLDGGGTLWVDRNRSGALGGINGYPIPFATTPSGTNPQVVAPLHPIMRFPYQLDYGGASSMGFTAGTGAIGPQTLAAGGAGSLSALLQTIEPGFASMNAIVANSAGVVVGVADVGAGKMVVTASDIGSKLNGAGGGTDIGLGPNTGPVAGQNFLALPATELKFSYNIGSISSSFGALSGSGRRLNSGKVSLGAPLLQAWSNPLLDLDVGDHANYFPPIVYKGLVLIVSGNTLYAYKADPSRDLDGDGWTDDGFQDASGGTPYDLVWRSTPLSAPLSSPAAGEARAVGSAPKDQVYVVDGRGNLQIFNALPTSQGRLLGTNPVAPAATVNAPSTPVMNFGVPGRGPYTPTILDGAIYVFDAVRNNVGQVVGRVWAASQTTGQAITTGGTAWVATGQGAPSVPEPGGSPTIGYIPVADGGGGLDAVIYVPNRSSAGGAAAGISSLWIGVKGEAPTVNRTANSIQIVTRAASKGLRIAQDGNGFGLRLTLIEDNTGRALTPGETSGFLDGTVTQFAPGQLNVGTTGSLPAGISVRLDYHIDWGTGAPNLMSQVIRGQIFFPDDVNRTRYPVKSMALAPNGNLFVTTANELSNGTLFVLNEFNRGQFKLKYRWDLYDQISIQVGGASTVQWGPALIDLDYLATNMVPFLNVPMRRLHFHGGATILGDVCYITVAGEKRALGGPRVTAILAFDADPDRIDIRLGAPITGGITIRQPDMAASSNRNVPEQYVTMQGNQVDIEESTGVIRFDNMMSNTNGQMRNALSTSLPVVVSSRTGGSQLVDPDANGSKWSPLLWYFVLNGFVNESPALVTGNTVYIAGGNILPDMLAGRGFQPRPALFGMDATIPPNDPSIITIPGRPGLKQSRWLYPDPTSPIGFTANSHVRWPSGEGVQSLNDFVIRLNQTLLDGSLDNSARGVVGGDGAVIAWADRGIHGFKQGVTVVADEGRIVETDAAGFALWNSDLTYQTAQNGNTALVQTRKLVRPTKAYVSGENEYLIVDTGGDRVIRLDKSAGEVRSIEGFLLDATYRPLGFHGGDEQKLRQPRDVSAWVDFVPASNNRLTNPRPMEFWVHYLIADTGNRRMIELVDRYEADANTFAVGNPVLDAQGTAQIGVLYWHTPESLSGKNWQYTAIQRIQVGIDGSGNAQFVYVAAVGDMLPTAANLGIQPPGGTNPREAGGTGGLVIFDPVNGDKVVNEINVFGVVKKLTAINSVAVKAHEINLGVIDYDIMFTDATGVYEIHSNGATWDTVWMMPNETYRTLRRVPLRASAAKRLPNGHVLITNSFFGRTDPGPDGDREFFGEVTQWLGDTFDPAAPNYGFAIDQIRFELPPVVGTRGLRSPQFADRH